MAIHVARLTPARLFLSFILLTVATVPGCSRQAPTDNKPVKEAPRQKVTLEIFQMAGTPEVPMKVQAGQQEIKIEDVFKPAGIDLTVHRVRFDLPSAPEVTLADLHALMLRHRSQTPPTNGDIAVQLIVATRETGRPQDLGIMFDYGDTDTDNYPREGFAVFATVHEHLPAGRDPELMLTIAHELTHVLNLHHGDWEPAGPGGTFDAGSTIESYSTAKDVKWALSDRSKLHLLSDPAKEKWPGRDNLAFGTMLRDHFKRHQPEPADEVWDVIEASGLNEKGRRARVAVLDAARTSPRDRSNVLPIDQSPVKLTLEVPKQTYEVGEPVTVTVGLHNGASQAMHVRPLIDPSYGFLNLDIQLPGSDVYLPFRSIVIREARAVRTALLEPGKSRHDEAKVFFGAGGWTLTAPGTYHFRADFPAAGATEAEALSARKRIQSAPLEIVVVAPRSAAGRQASRLLLGAQEGLYLLFGGGDHLNGALKIKEAAGIAGTSPQGDAARLAVAQATLNPTLGVTSQDVKVQEALQYLSKTSTAAAGPFSVAQTYDDAADALEKQGKPVQATEVRRRAKVRLGKVEAGPEAIRRAQPPK
jgi:hypothetical protein